MSLAVLGSLDSLKVAVEPPLVIKAGVVESCLDVQLSDLVKVTLIYDEVRLNILLDLPVDSALRDDGASIVDTPGEADLNWALSILLTELFQDRLVDDAHHM